MKEVLIFALAISVVLLFACGGRSMGANENASHDSGMNNDQDGAVQSLCEQGICEGCCDADGVCHPGISDNQCGRLSEECADCAALSGSCVDGQCLGNEPCGPHNCAEGCCTDTGNCVSGSLQHACGVNGSQCVDCGTHDCREGACCLDRDSDGFGEGCPLGEDCDDEAPGISGPCQLNGCPEGWAFVPSGVFTAGCAEGTNDNSYTQPPEHERYLDAFCIEPTEVTVAAYRECQYQGVCVDLYYQEPGCNWSVDGTGDRPGFPMNCIGWLETRSYCQSWFGGDLPTEWQWEKAARGTDARPFPWGVESPLDCNRCNYAWCLGEDQDTYMWPAGYLSSSDGDSPYGLKDMCGNIMELTRSCIGSYENRDECLLDGNEVNVSRGWGGWPDPSLVDDEIIYTTYYRGPYQDLFGDGSTGHGFRCMKLPASSSYSP